ncbi:hypothetical protein Tco_1333566, partial [Tanacetum coccineum]
ASIRSDLLFDDADGIDVLNNQDIFDNIQLMGYEGDLTILTFNKALFSPQWKFFFHTMNHFISSKSTSWDQIPTNIATAVICLATNQKYNFSKLIFDGMIRHLDAKKKFVMYPRFISIFLDKQLKKVPVPLDHFPINALTSKVFSFMVKKGKHFSGNITPLFASMLVPPTQDEGEASKRQSEPQPTPSPHQSADLHETEPNQSPRPSPSVPIPNPIPEVSGGDQREEKKSLRAQVKRLKKLSKPYIRHHKAWLRAVKLKTHQKQLDKSKKRRSVSKQGRKTIKSSKGDPSVPTNTKWNELDDIDDTMDYILAQDEGKTDQVKEQEEGTVKQQSTDKPTESTDKPNEGTDSEKVSTDRVEEGTAEARDEQRTTPTTPTPTPTTFRDDETIAQVLLNISQAKAVSKEKEKGVEIKDVERPRITSTRSVLTLQPLPKIDPKDKGKKRIEEDDESGTESD